MKLYIIFPGSLFPLQGMSQVRTLNQLRSLRKDHDIIFSDMVSKSESVDLCEDEMSSLGIVYCPLFMKTYKKTMISKGLARIRKQAIYHLKTISPEEAGFDASLQKQAKDIVIRHNPEGVLLHYWHFGMIFNDTNHNILRMIDTHYVVEENIELLDRYKASKYLKWKMNREFRYSLEKQREYFNQCDLVIANSEKQRSLIHEWNPGIRVQVTVNGQELSKYLEFRGAQLAETAICFYGSLSNQFNRIALSRVINSIFPKIKSYLPETKLYVIGASPPQDILGHIEDPDIIVTGYLDDPRDYLCRTKCLVLPLETGSGFRGRIVEVMALGIPVVGTSNALQSIGMIDGRHGFIVEYDDEIVERAVKLLSDDPTYKQLSEASRSFAAEHFSLETTFGKLSLDIETLAEHKRR